MMASPEQQLSRVPDARPFFQTLLKRMEGAVAIDAWLVGIGSEGALLAAQLAGHLPGKHPHVRLCPRSLSEGALKWYPETPIPENVPVVLVDAVLWQGERVVKAVHLLRTQGGITRAIELAALVDRGGHSVPIALTYAGGELLVAEDTSLRLGQDAEGLVFSEERR